MNNTQLRHATIATLLFVGGAALAGKPIKNKLDVPTPNIAASTDPEVIARGRYLVYGPARCSQCHADYLRENPAGNTADSVLSGGLHIDFGPMGETYGANLTSHATGLGSKSDADIARAIQHAVLSDNTVGVLMAFDAADLSDADLTAVVSFLRTLPPVEKTVAGDELSGMGRLLFKKFGGVADLTPAPPAMVVSDEPSVEQGAYLVEQVAGCTMCHSNYSMKGGFHLVEPLGGGGPPDRDPLDPEKVYVAPNLTSHATGRTGMWSEDEFVARMKAGRAYPSSKMAWENFQRTSDADLRSIYRYLRTMTPIDNDVGPSWRDKDWEAGRD
jgi:mono/diheme cytochrome c family protein